MARKGKSFELLIKKLEGILLPTGAIIKSPDYIEDKITGSKREADITIKSSNEPGAHLTIIECRDRKSVEDLLWIEQLVTKFKDTNANKLVAVSSAGFSKNAIAKASHHGIELKTYKEISLDDIQSWSRLEYMEIYEHHSQILHANVYLGDIKPLEPSPFEDKRLDEIRLIRTLNNQEVSLIEIFNETINIANIQGLVPNIFYEQRIAIPCGETLKDYQIKHDGKYYLVHAIELTVRFQIVSRLAPMSRATTYSGKDKASAQVLEFDGVLPSEHQTLQLIQAGDGSILISSK